MKRWVKLLVLALVAGGLSGCWAKQADLDALRAEHDQLKADHDLIVTQLSTWAQATYDWENRTFQTVCDIAKVNGPLTRYSDATELYCSDTDGNGAPPPPPQWGQD